MDSRYGYCPTELCIGFSRKSRNDMENEEKIIKNTEKILKKLISEEIIASDFYNGCVSNVKPEQAVFIAKKFQEIAADEMGDHWASLDEFAR